MHAIFIAYGIREAVEHFYMDLQAQKHKFTMTSPDGKETKTYWLQGSLRLLPFGVVEYVFPKEDMDMVLTTLNFNIDDARYNLGWFRKAFLRKILKAEPIPEFKKEAAYLWFKENVQIIPIGIRHDNEPYVEPKGEFKGWTHEAI